MLTLLLFGVNLWTDKGWQISGVTSKGQTIVERPGEANLVMFNHSREHMSGQAAAFVAARRVSPHGACVVLIPIAAWKQYGSGILA